MGAIYWVSYLYKERKSKSGNRSESAGFIAGIDVSNRMDI